jgi:hypothetical protein
MEEAVIGERRSRMSESSQKYTGHRVGFLVGKNIVPTFID